MLYTIGYIGYMMWLLFDVFYLSTVWYIIIAMSIIYQ